MKRIVMLVFAIALVAIWTVPAMAEVSFDGEYRLRGETKNNADFTDENGDRGTSYGQRVRLTGTATPTDDVTVKITIQDTRTWGQAVAGAGGPSLTDTTCVIGLTADSDWVDAGTDGVTADDAGVTFQLGSCNTLDLHESYVKIDNFFNTRYDVTLGRQELSYGDQRLIGAFGWSNNARSFDAIKVTSKSDTYNLDVFTAKVAEGSTGSNDQDLYAIYATINTLPNASLDVYAILLKDGSNDAFVSNANDATASIASGDAADQDLTTFGLRIKGTANVIDYTFEIATQDGSIDSISGATATNDVSGMAYALKLGYAIPNNANNIKIGLEYLHADGDDDVTDGDIETFSNLFPTNHGHMGYADQQGWRNVDAWSVNVKGEVDEKLSLSLAYWSFALAEEDDAWYSAGNWMNTSGGIRAGNGVANGALAANAYTEDEVGTEIDLQGKYKYNDAIGFVFGYSIFQAGDALDERAEDVYGAGVDADDLDYAYLQLTAKF